VNLDAGDFGFAGRDRQRHALKQREVEVYIQGFRFEADETIDVMALVEFFQHAVQLARDRLVTRTPKM